jgi:hypothetical protein
MGVPELIAKSFAKPAPKAPESSIPDGKPSWKGA